MQIARELRLRDIGGIIVVDFIDMTDDCKISASTLIELITLCKWMSRICAFFQIHAPLCLQLPFVSPSLLLFLLSY